MGVNPDAFTGLRPPRIRLHVILLVPVPNDADFFAKSGSLFIFELHVRDVLLP
jgi:hypothetical protein